MYWLKKETQELSMEIKNFRAGEKKSKRILRLFLNKIKAPTKLNGENASLFWLWDKRTWWFLSENCLGQVKVKSFSRVRLFATPWTVAYQASRSMGFSRQGYWSGLLFPSPGGLPDPGI